VPSWKTHIFSWHPVLMVCGFFFSQVFAITAWGLFPSRNRRFEEFSHVFWQLAACGTLISGLIVSNMSCSP
jgi:hypothetical protein